MKKVVFTKVRDFDGNVFYVERKRIQIERVREYGEIEKYATFDGNGYDGYNRRLGYILEARVYFSNFDMSWEDATSGSATAVDKSGKTIKFVVEDKNLQNSITKFIEEQWAGGKTRKILVTYKRKDKK